MGKNFQTDNVKHTISRTDIYNPNFENPIKLSDGDFIDKNIEKWAELISFLRWYPDIAYDLIKPQKGKKLELDPDQRLALRMLVRNPDAYMCVIRGFGKCVSADTMINTSRGFLEIGELFDYSKPDGELEYLHDIDIINRYGIPEKSTAGISSGYKDTKKIRTRDGYEIEVSNNHPLMVMDKDGVLKWKKAIDLSPKDYLCISRKENVFKDDEFLNIDMNGYLDNLSKHARHQVLRGSFTEDTPDKMSKELAYVLGLLVGDGTVTSDKQIYFTNIDGELIDIFKDYFENTLGKKVTSNGKEHLVSGMYTREFFRQVGLDYCNAFTKEVPKSILKSSEDSIVKFLMGLFDTDGCVEKNNIVTLCTASEKLSKQIQTLLASLGIISSRRKKYNKKYKTYSYNICISGENVEKYKNKIGFMTKRKQNRLLDICRKDNRGNTNKNIIPHQNEFVKKLNLKGENRQYLANVIYGKNGLSYDKLEFLCNLDCIDNNDKIYLEMLRELNYFYSPIDTIEDSENWVYDIHVPESKSFIGNSFVNHNTMLHIMAHYHIARYFPNVKLSVTASTRESATSIWRAKHKELLEFYPALKDEIKSESWQKDKGEVVWINGATIDSLANSQQSKGQRRNRGGL